MMNLDDTTPLVVPPKKPWHKLRWQERRIVTILPYTWLLIFFFVPFLLVFKISLSEPVLSVPPYQEIFKWMDGILNIHLNLNNYIRMVTDPFYAQGFMTSLIIAAITTFGCLVLGFLIAYAIVCAPRHWRFILLLMVVLPLTFCIPLVD